MALRVAVASGDWSNPATWNGGVLPTVGDIVASNTYTVTIDQNINVDVLTNAALTNPVITAQMTSNTTPSGVVNASSIYSGAYEPWRAFNQAAGEWVSNSPTGWLSYEFTTPRIVKVYQMLPPGFIAPNTAPRNWSFEGWDGSGWVVLDTVTGNSGIGTVTRTISNSIAYISYRINITLNNSADYTGVQELRLYDTVDYTISAIAGGGFILNNGVTAQANTLITGGSKNLVECSIATGQSATIIGNITGGTVQFNTINFTGTGTLSIIGNLYVTNGFTNSYPLRISGTGTVNITGNVTSNDFNQVRGIVSVAGNCTLNVTGDVVWTLNGGTVTPSPLIRVESICTINVVGSVIGGPTMWAIGNTTITGSTQIYLSVIGPIISRVGNSSTSSSVAIQNISPTSIIILTGPFISSSDGVQPLYVTRMFYRRTMGSYFEFRDNSTNGALPPAAPAPATRLVSPDTVVDAPIPANVRQGVVYASGSQTGTMVVPSPSNVTINVPVDNTVGTAILNADNLWAIDTSTMNTANSIGERLKNAATVQTVGDQLVSLL